MRVAYFEALGGASGDMILGALLDAGVPFDQVQHELAKVPLGGYRLHRQAVRKLHISATQFMVEVELDDTHEHTHESIFHGRSLHDIETLIASSRLKEQVRSTAMRVFRRLGEAEARVHGVSVEDVHFHDVGSIDTVVDIVGTAIALDLLHIEGVYCSALPLGSGTIKTRHGDFPIPAPATLDLLTSAGAPVVASAIHAEQVTPTGAALLSTLARFEQPSLMLESVGYGAGQADLTIPNVVRVSIGITEATIVEGVTVLESNVNAMNPEV